MVIISKDDYIWVQPVTNNEFDKHDVKLEAIGARIVSTEGVISIIDDDGIKRNISPHDQITLMKSCEICGIENLICLENPHPAAIVRDIQLRFKQKLFFTWVGQNILIHVNPNMTQPPIYGLKQIAAYRSAHILPANIFSMAKRAHLWICGSEGEEPRNTAIIINGMSTISKHLNFEEACRFLVIGSKIRHRFEAALSIVRAIGSSINDDELTCCGKLVEILFDKFPSSGGLFPAAIAAKINIFLLNKSNIIRMAKSATNYKIFHAILSDEQVQKRLNLGLMSANQDTQKFNGCENRTFSLKHFYSALSILSFNNTEIDHIIKLLACFLHLSNLKYKAIKTQDNGEAVEIFDSENELTSIQRLLQVNREKLIVLLTQGINISDHNSSVPFDAVRFRDFIMAESYHRLLEYITKRINEVLCKPKYQQSLKEKNLGSIFVVEAPTLEPNADFINCLEQISGNYLHEHLQQLFIRSQFKRQKSEPENQSAADMSDFHLPDNSDTIEMLSNLISVIGHESSKNESVDFIRLQRLVEGRCKKARINSDQKSVNIIHSVTGPINYGLKELIDKNKENYYYKHVYANLRELISSTKLELLQNLYSEYFMNKQNNLDLMKAELDDVVVKLSQNELQFVFCINPNEIRTECSSMIFDRDNVFQQLKLLAIPEIIAVNRAGFSISYEYTDFIKNFGILGECDKMETTQDYCIYSTKLICQRILKQESNVKYGHTNVFLKENQHTLLKQAKDEFRSRYAIIIQRSIRRWLHLQKFKKLRNAAIVFQRYWRARAEMIRYKKVLKGINRLKAIFISRRLSTFYKRIHSVIVKVQIGEDLRKFLTLKANCRGSIVRSQLKSLHHWPERRAAMVKRYHELLASIGDSHWFQYDPVIDVFFDGEEMGKPRNQQQTNNYRNFKFNKFALTYFQKNILDGHLRKLMHKPLLMQSTSLDNVLALLGWAVMLRYMGDLPEYSLSMHDDDNFSECEEFRDYLENSFVQANKNQNTIIRIRLAFSQLVKYINSHKKPSEFESLVYCFLQQEANNFDGYFKGESLSKNSGWKRLLSRLIRLPCALDKIQFLVACGILRSSIRDELYCQLCKQICRNPSSKSSNRGWLLMAIYAGCFAPSEKFLPYLLSFIYEYGTSKISSLIEYRLLRTLKNGTRQQPPNTSELTAVVKMEKFLNVEISLPSGRFVNTFIDSASTSSELCSQICELLDIPNAFGYGIQITAQNGKIYSLKQSRQKYVLDAISMCEQGKNEVGDKCSWKFLFRKEIFSPFITCEEFEGAELAFVYSQIVHEIREFSFESDDELAVLMAEQLYINSNGSIEVDFKAFEELLPSILPHFVFRENSDNQLIIEKWLQLSMNAFRKKFQKPSHSDSINDVKVRIVKMALDKWPLRFSRIYDAYKFLGPPMLSNKVRICLNHMGIRLESTNKSRCEGTEFRSYSFMEISSIGYNKSKQIGADTFSLNFANRERYIFQSSSAEEMHEMIRYFLNGLRLRSRYAIGFDQDNSKEFLECKRGDVLILEKKFGQLKPNDVIFVENTRTGQRGKYPVSLLHILPILKMPSRSEIEGIFSREKAKALERDESMYNGSLIHVREPSYSLENFAINNFRAPTFQEIQRGIALWRHSFELLNFPLLKKLENRDELFVEALTSYNFILRYMGDHPSPQPPRYFLEHTDLIFDAPLKYEILRDEIYCQLMKQLTDNVNPYSEERGWELLWLCLGIFPPSTSFYPELCKFLQSAHFLLARDCQNRLENSMRLNVWRKFPPHQVEVESIQFKITQIFHKFNFPDGSNRPVKVDSQIRASEVCLNIINMLNIESPLGFGLFVKIRDKVVCIPENEFFFDFIQQVAEWIRKNSPRNYVLFNPLTNYSVYFMKKLWIDVNISNEPNSADLIFHYYQEIPKYLRGYHNVKKEDVVYIAALLLKAEIQEHRHFSHKQLYPILQHFIPRDMIKTAKKSEWCKMITEAYYNADILSPNEAKMTFLKFMSDFVTFGSTFFDVTQSSDPTMQSKLIVAINWKGINIFSQESKSHIISYPFESIVNWQPANTYILITVYGTGNKESRLLFETTLGFKIDDLLTSYIQYLLGKKEKQIGKESINQRMFA